MSFAENRYSAGDFPSLRAQAGYPLGGGWSESFRARLELIETNDTRRR
jgi:hypothetical protein